MTRHKVALGVVAVLMGCSQAQPPPVADAGRDAGPTCLPADAGPVDAGPSDGGDFTCAGQHPPPGAVSHLEIDGFVTAAGLVRPRLAGVRVELFGPTDGVLASQVTDDGGTYSLGSDIACAPLAGYVKAGNRDAGFYDSYYYPPSPWRVSRDSLEMVVFDNAARGLVAAIASVTIQDGTAALALGIEDCAGAPVVGATVTTVPAGDVRYVGASGLPSQMETATTTKGQLLVFNLAPGMVQVTATVGGRSLAATVNARADSITTTVIQP